MTTRVLIVATTGVDPFAVRRGAGLEPVVVWRIREVE